jgi:ADP-ribosyl-[dinitrogen reductase] hydrolase
MEQAERVIGCLLGGAIGDCLGGPYEGAKAPVAVRHEHAWQLSDDTQLTLATCEAISTHGAVDPARIASTYAAWFSDARITGMGAATYKALTELSQGGHWALVGLRGERAAGNGAAMRVAPLAFCMDPKEPQARAVIRDVCRITHHHEEAYAGALAVALAVRAAWEGTWNGEPTLLASVIDHLPDSRVRDRLADLTSLHERATVREVAERFGCSGYVVESIPLALWAAQRVKRLGMEALLYEVVAVGGDADTIASIVGQVAGTYTGREGIPDRLIDGLPDLGMITGIVTAFSVWAVRAMGHMEHWRTSRLSTT